MQFILFGWKPFSGDMVDRFVKMDFADGAKLIGEYYTGHKGALGR